MRRWTQLEIDIVRQDYRGTDASCQEIANRLGRTFTSVRYQVYQQGVQTRTSRRAWTSDEEERLAELIRQFPVSKVARRMHRSLASVTVRAKVLHISRRIRDGWFTKQEVAEICGTEHNKVQRWIDKGDLVASYHNGHRPARGGLAMWHITDRALVRFLVNHAIELNGRNVDLVAIVGLLRRD